MEASCRPSACSRVVARGLRGPWGHSQLPPGYPPIGRGDVLSAQTSSAFSSLGENNPALTLNAPAQPRGSESRERRHWEPDSSS